MSDLIRREDVVEALYEAIRTDLKSTFTDSMSLAIAMAENIPSAEPERKTGKWIDTGWRVIYKCSNCGNFLDFNGLNAGRGDANYCPNCGARMEME